MFFGWVLAVVCSIHAYAEPSIHVIENFSASHQTVHPEDIFTLKATLPHTDCCEILQLLFVGQFSDIRKELPQEFIHAYRKNALQHEWDVVLPQNGYGSYGFLLIAMDKGNIYSTDPVFVQVDLDDKRLSFMKVSPVKDFLFVGMTKQLRVSGIHTDGVMRDLTHSSTGTVYTEVGFKDKPFSDIVEKNTFVIDVSVNGEVTALAPGKAGVKVIHNNKEQTIWFEVEESDIGKE